MDTSTSAKSTEEFREESLDELFEHMAASRIYYDGKLTMATMVWSGARVIWRKFQGFWEIDFIQEADGSIIESRIEDEMQNKKLR